jgi:hypothetical protein
MIDLEELKEALSHWKESVKWIAKGWDCGVNPESETTG